MKAKVEQLDSKLLVLKLLKLLKFQKKAGVELPKWNLKVSVHWTPDEIVLQ